MQKIGICFQRKAYCQTTREASDNVIKGLKLLMDCGENVWDSDVDLRPDIDVTEEQKRLMRKAQDWLNSVASETKPYGEDDSVVETISFINN